MRDVDLNQPLVGKDTPRHQTKLCKGDLASGEVQMIHNPRTIEALDDRSIALYDITAATNLKTSLTNKRQYTIEKIQIPSIPLCDGAIHISSDSMYLMLKSGDIVGFKKINSFSNLIYGEAYLVSFTVEGDEYLTVECMNRSKKEGYLRLVSCNARHDPVNVLSSTINAMTVVKFSIRRHMVV